MTFTINWRTVVYCFMGLVASAMAGALSAVVFFGAEAFFAGMIVGISVLTVPGWCSILEKGIHRHEKLVGKDGVNLFDALWSFSSAWALAALVFFNIAPIFDGAIGEDSEIAYILCLMVGYSTLFAGAAIGIWIANGIRVMTRAINAAIYRKSNS